MYDNTTFWLIVIVSAWWYWNKQKREKEKKEAARAPRAKTEASVPEAQEEQRDEFLASVEDSTCAKPKKGNKKERRDEFLASVEEYAEKKAGEVQSVAEQYEKELEEKYDQDLKKKQRLSEFARDHQLDRALIGVWEQVKYYPAWSKREDFQQWNKLGVSDCLGSEEKNGRNEIKKVSFSFGGRRYEITYVEQRMFDGDQHADFTLAENEEGGFAIKTSIECDEVGTTYVCFDISTFKKKGEWPKFLLDAWEIIETRGRKQRADFKYFDADKIKGNFED